RYNIELHPLDSWSTRVSWNPAHNWAMQVSFGRLRQPEQLEPNVDVDRTTASVTYNLPLPQGGWQTTLAAARNAQRPGMHTQAYLLESALPLRRGLTLFGRAERVGKNELFVDAAPLQGRVFEVDKFSAGVVRDFASTQPLHWGIGAAYSHH